MTRNDLRLDDLAASRAVALIVGGWHSCPMATACANEQCPNPDGHDGSAPILMPPLQFCSDGCVQEYLMQAFVTDGKLGQAVLDGFRSERRRRPG